MPFMGYGPNDEIRYIGVLDQAEKRAKADASQISADAAARGAHISRVAPWLNSGTLLALLKGTGSMEPVQRIATMAAQDKALSNPTGRRPGDDVTGAQTSPGDRRMFRLDWEDRAFAINEARTDFENTYKNRARYFQLGGRGRVAGLSPLDDAVRKGLMTYQGYLIVPQRRFNEIKDKWEYDNPEAAHTFNNYISHFVGGQRIDYQGPPIPSVSNGQIGLYFPTSDTFTNEPQDMKSKGIKGMVAESIGALGHAVGEPIFSIRRPDILGMGAIPSTEEQLKPITDYVHSRRLPVPPGTGMIPKGEAPIGALEDYARSRRLPQLPGPVGQVQEANAQRAGATDVSLMATARDYMMALSALPQEFQGQIRNFHGAATGRDVNWWEPQSDLGIMLGTGMNPDAPNGDTSLWVAPDSEVAKERRKREAERGLINGQRATLGRMVAAGASDLGIIEPDSTAYRVFSGIVDAGVQLYADPTAIGLGKAADIGEARRLFTLAEEDGTKVGLIKGVFSNSLYRPHVDAFLDGPQGTHVLSKIAEESSIAKIDEATGFKLMPEELVSLADAHSTEEARAALKPLLGKRIRTTRDIWADPTFASPRRYGPESWRNLVSNQLEDVPGAAIDPNDGRQTLDETRKWLVNSHVEPAYVDEFVGQMARSTSYEDKLNSLDAMMLHSQGVLSKMGVPAETRSRMVAGWRDSMSKARANFIDEALTHAANNDEVKIAEDIVGTGDPFLWAEMSDHVIMLPDFRQWRRLTDGMPKLGWDDEGKLRWPAAAIESWQNEVWKPFMLLRLAWPVRVIGEEQLRMGARGWAGAFHDPVSFIAHAIGRREDALGTPFQETKEWQRAMGEKGRAGWAGDLPGRVHSGPQKAIKLGDPGHLDGWAENIAKLSRDEVAPDLARSNNMDEAMDWFRNSDIRRQWMEKKPVLGQEDASRRYLELLGKRIEHYTGGNDELMDAVRTGKFRGEDVIDPKTLRASDTLKAALKDELYDAAPPMVVGDQVRTKWQNRSGVVDKMFGALMATPSRVLSRNPVFTQAYWSRLEEIIPGMTPEAKAELLEQARSGYLVHMGPFTLGKGKIKDWERIAAKGELGLAEADQYAKGYALDETKFLLYDLSKRSQIADGMRLVAPFGEAWKEVVTRWAQLANPASLRGAKNLRRFQQLYMGARGRDLGAVLGSPKDIEGHRMGFFWKDEYGDETFVYPGSQWLTQQKWAHVPDWVPAVGGIGAPGMPVPLTGRVAGLSMFGTVIPGLGPAAAIPASWILQDKPGWQRWARQYVLPFGTITDETGQSALFQALNYAPPWMRQGVQALMSGGYDQQTNRIWANTQMSAANYLYSTGKYDTTSTAGQAKLMEDAKKAARNLFFVKSMVAFGAPAAPRADFLVQTNDRMVRYAALRDDYVRMIGEFGPADADEEFLKRWGDQAGMTMQSFTREIQGGVGVSREYGDWAKHNKDLAVKYPATYAFFGPQGGTFDYPTYVHQIDTGQRQQLDLETWFAMGQHHLGSMIVDRASAMMPDNPSDEDRAWYDSVVDWTYRHYPGYNDPQGQVSRTKFEVVERELGKAVKDKSITKTEAGKALAQYWAARNQVLAVAKNNGLKTINGNALAADRQWLFDGGQFLARQYPDFKAIWNRWLRSEVEPDSGP